MGARQVCFKLAPSSVASSALCQGAANPQEPLRRVALERRNGVVGADGDGERRTNIGVKCSCLTRWQVRVAPLKPGQEVQARVCAGSSWVNGRIVRVNSDSGTYDIVYRFTICLCLPISFAHAR